MYILPYNRIAAVAYALKWANARNPKYYAFDKIGGDCTNFVSQCVYAGSGVMNYTPTFGWYYISANDRAPAWTSVDFFYDFMTGNMNVGPFASVTDSENAVLGDVVQLGNSLGEFYHSLIITRKRGPRIYVTAHSRDVLDEPLSRYNYDKIRFLHIEGVRHI